MQEIIKKIRIAVEELSSEFGKFELAALLEREDLPHCWDLVVCASWLNIPGNLGRDLDLIFDALDRAGLTKKEKPFIARVMMLRPTDEVTAEIRAFLAKSRGERQYGPRTFGNMTILSGYLIAPDPRLQAARKSMAKRPLVRFAKMRHRVAA